MVCFGMAGLAGHNNPRSTDELRTPDQQSEQITTPGTASCEVHSQPLSLIRMRGRISRIGKLSSCTRTVADTQTPLDDRFRMSLCSENLASANGILPFHSLLGETQLQVSCPPKA